VVFFLDMSEKRMNRQSTHRATRSNIPVDYRVVVSIDAPEAWTVSQVIEMFTPSKRDFKVLSVHSDSTGLHVTASYVFNTIANQRTIGEAFDKEYDDQGVPADVDVDMISYSLIRKGVSANMLTIDTALPETNMALLVGAALGQNGVLNAQLLYDMITQSGEDYVTYARKSLLGEYIDHEFYGWDHWHPYHVFQVSENSDLLCRMVEHDGIMRWQTVGSISQVQGTEPFVFPKQLLPVDPVGPPPYYYSTRLTSSGESESECNLAAKAYLRLITDHVGVGNIVSRTNPVYTRTYQVIRRIHVVYRSKNPPYEAYNQLQRVELIDEDIHGYASMFKRIV
jgi:hypothetical protein